MRPRSPIRFPGGKTQIAPLLARLIMRTDARDVVSPFVGGASVEITLARHLRVWAYDLHAPLVNFWRWALRDPGGLAASVDLMRPVTRQDYVAMREALAARPYNSTLAAAARYFLLNRCSFGGASMSGRFAPGTPSLHDAAVARLARFSCPGLSVGLADFEVSLLAHPEAVVFADPPYPLTSWKERLYGTDGDLHRDFDHYRLAGALADREQFLLCYRDCDLIRDLYTPFADIRALDRRHRLGPKPSALNEVLIAPVGLL